MTQDDDWWLSRVSPWGVTRVTTGLGLSLPNNVTQMVVAVTATPTPTSHHTLHSQHSIQSRLVKTRDTSQSLPEYLRRLERELSTMLCSYLWGELCWVGSEESWALPLQAPLAPPHLMICIRHSHSLLQCYTYVVNCFQYNVHLR